MPIRFVVFFFFDLLFAYLYLIECQPLVLPRPLLSCIFITKQEDSLFGSLQNLRAGKSNQLHSKIINGKISNFNSSHFVLPSPFLSLSLPLPLLLALHSTMLSLTLSKPPSLRLQGPFQGTVSSFISYLSSVQAPIDLYLCGWDAGLANIFSILEYLKVFSPTHHPPICKPSFSIISYYFLALPSPFILLTVSHRTALT